MDSMSTLTSIELEAAFGVELSAGLDRVFSRADIWEAVSAIREVRPDLSVAGIRAVLDAAAERAVGLPGITLSLSGCLVIPAC